MRMTLRERVQLLGSQEVIRQEVAERGNGIEDLMQKGILTKNFASLVQTVLFAGQRKIGKMNKKRHKRFFKMLPSILVVLSTVPHEIK